MTSTHSVLRVAWFLVAVIVLIRVRVCHGAPELDDGGEKSKERDDKHVVTGERLLEKLKGPSSAAQLPSKTALHRIRLLLKRIDTSGDEAITKGEMFAWILQSQRILTREKVNLRLSAVDKDKDDRVSWEEHLSDVKAGDGAKRNKASVIKLREQHDREMFELADTDEDGLLTVEEYHGFRWGKTTQNKLARAQPGEKPAFPGEDPQLLSLLRTHVMMRSDADKDGRLSFREYLFHNMLSDESDYSLQLMERERFDAFHDQDGDGFLSPDEVERMLDADHRGTARKAVKHLLEEMDEDLDESLSFEEVFRHRDAFQSSEASDFGNHLTKTHRLKDEL